MKTLRLLVVSIVAGILQSALLTSYTLAAAVPKVVINEIAWMGTSSATNDEWMELKNTTSQDINLEGWLLRTTNGKIKAYLRGIIPAKGFYLLERTDDTTVKEVKADFIYTGALSNTGESLELLKNAQEFIDSVAFSAQWPAGDNKTKKTMERTADYASWQTSKNSNGTPKAENSVLVTVQEPLENGKEPPGTSEKSPQTKILITEYPKGVVINEILPSPEGADQTNEWIELYNTSDKEISLAGWTIQDEGIKTAYIFKQQANIAPKGYLVIKRPESNITLNNDKDTITISYPDKSLAFTVSYQKAPTNQSYNRSPSGWRWSSKLTPGAANVLSANPITKDSSATKPQLKAKPLSPEFVGEAALADISETAEFKKNNTSNPWLLFFAALAIAVVAGIIAGVVRFKFFYKNNVGT